MLRKSLAVLCLAAFAASGVSAAGLNHTRTQLEAPEYYATVPDSLEELRCQTPTQEERIALYGVPNFSDPADCSQFATNPTDDYDGTVVYEIPIVTHVVMDDSCTNGVVSDEMVATQIDILNEDFLALLNGNGEEGHKTLIRFRQAKVDPDGNPTNGITRTCNTTYYNDGGGYYNELSWDPHTYMNLYTNNNLALGYVPFLPADAGGGFVGSASDRVVVLWDSFGRNSPIPTYNLGRTSTHEVGHYLGLEHTFTGGCGLADPPGCYGSGDLICDTNAESGPTFSPCELGDKNTCDSVDPSDNYMDYSDDICMNKFTLEQSRRMRCTLENYRVDLATTVEDFLTLTVASPSQPGTSNDWMIEDAEPGSEIWLLVSSTPGSIELRDCPGVLLDIDDVKVAGSVIADSDGRGMITATPPAGAVGTFFYQAVELSTCSMSNRASSVF